VQDGAPPRLGLLLQESIVPGGGARGEREALLEFGVGHVLAMPQRPSAGALPCVAAS